MQQIADYLMLPVHAVKEGYKQACEKGMKARIPKERLQRIDRKKEELTPHQYYRKMQADKKEEGRKKAKGKRSSAWRALNYQERKAAKTEKRKHKIERNENVEINRHNPNRPPQKFVPNGTLKMAYDKYKIVNETERSITYERPNGLQFTASK